MCTHIYIGIHKINKLYIYIPICLDEGMYMYRSLDHIISNVLESSRGVMSID